MQIEITEMGNGFPATGELVGCWCEGESKIYRVGEGGTIEPHSSGFGNTCVCEAEEVDADEVANEINFDADDLGLRLVGIEVIAD